MSRCAWLLAVFLAGCLAVAPQGTPKSAVDPAESAFQRAAELLEKEKFSEAIRAFQKIVEQFPNHVRAEDALYFSGYAHLHYRNPEVDVAEALRNFQRLVRVYPKSANRDHAQNWITLLTSFQTVQTERDKLKQDLQRLLDLDVQSEKKRREIR